jgi:outer membrane protein assembly factor BamB
MFSSSITPPAIPLGMVFVGALSSLLFSQSQFPVGGYSKPIWEAHAQDFYSRADVCPDLTGDGVEDVLCYRYDPGGDVVLDGVTGEIWFHAPRGFGNNYPALVDDLDGDGTADLVLRNEHYSSAMTIEGGAVALVQGGSGEILWQIQGTTDHENLGQHFQLMDLDGSGFPDVLSFVSRDSMQAISGQTGTILWKHSSQWIDEIRPIGDQNGDGIVDLIGLGFKFVALIDGATGTSLWSNGYTIAELEYWADIDFYDLTGDDIKDIVLRNRRSDNGIGTWAGGVQVLNGTDGQLLWEVFGSVPFAQLGRTLRLFDADGDQDLDLLTAGQGVITALEGRSGAVLWTQVGSVNPVGSAPWLETEINNDGVVDFICREGTTTTNPQSILCLSGIDGTELWRVEATDPFALIREMHLVDLDADGGMDLVAAVPHSDDHPEVFAVDVLTGAVKWSHSRAFGFGERMAAFVDTQGRATVLASTRSNGSPSSILGLNGVDGSVKWKIEQSLDPNQYRFWYWQDLNGDGDLELIDWERAHHEVLLIHPETGEVFNQHQTDMSNPDFSGTLPDLDGDGYREIVSSSGIINYESSVQVHSGIQDSYSTGLTLIGDELSVSQGGLVVVGVQFQRRLRNGYYRLLMSTHGVGPTTLFDVEIPLTSDRVFQHTESGDYPSTFHAPTGRLDNNAEAVIAIQAVPNQIPSSLVGHLVHLAVVGENQLGWTTFSSGAETISILP